MCATSVCRKQSSTDLQSRLKSRKILGVGVTDDGQDVHRSKVSNPHLELVNVATSVNSHAKPGGLLVTSHNSIRHFDVKATM